jgi:hypothetical protein
MSKREIVMILKTNGVSDASTLQTDVRNSWDPVQRAERRIEAVRRLRQLERLLGGASAMVRAS